MTGGNKRKQEAPSQSALQDDHKHTNSDEAGGRGARGKRALEGDETSKGRARGRSKKVSARQWKSRCCRYGVLRSQHHDEVSHLVPGLAVATIRFDLIDRAPCSTA